MRLTEQLQLAIYLIVKYIATVRPMTDRCVCKLVVALPNPMTARQLLAGKEEFKISLMFRLLKRGSMPVQNASWSLLK